MANDKVRDEALTKALLWDDPPAVATVEYLGEDARTALEMMLNCAFILRLGEYLFEIIHLVACDVEPVHQELPVGILCPYLFGGERSTGLDSARTIRSFCRFEVHASSSPVSLDSCLQVEQSRLWSSVINPAATKASPARRRAASTTDLVSNT